MLLGYPRIGVRDYGRGRHAFYERRGDGWVRVPRVNLTYKRLRHSIHNANRSPRIEAYAHRVLAARGVREIKYEAPTNGDPTYHDLGAYYNKGVLHLASKDCCLLLHEAHHALLGDMRRTNYGAHAYSDANEIDVARCDLRVLHLMGYTLLCNAWRNAFGWPFYSNLDLTMLPEADRLLGKWRREV